MDDLTELTRKYAEAEAAYNNYMADLPEVNVNSQAWQNFVAGSHKLHAKVWQAQILMVRAQVSAAGVKRR